MASSVLFCANGAPSIGVSVSIISSVRSDTQYAMYANCKTDACMHASININNNNKTARSLALLANVKPQLIPSLS